MREMDYRHSNNNNLPPPPRLRLLLRINTVSSYIFHGKMGNVCIIFIIIYMNPLDPHGFFLHGFVLHIFTLVLSGVMYKHY